MLHPRYLSPLLLFFIFFTLPLLSHAQEETDKCSLCKNGFCYHGGRCACRFSWAGEHCDKYIFASIPGVFIFFRVSFLIFFTILLSITLVICWHAFKEKFAYYYKVGFVLISFDCVVQIVIYASSVETIEGVPAAYITSFLTVVHFGLIYFTYSVYLLWWVELNDKYKKIKRGMTQFSGKADGQNGGSGSRQYSSSFSSNSKNNSSNSKNNSSSSSDKNEDLTANVVISGTNLQVQLKTSSSLPLKEFEGSVEVDLESGMAKEEENESDVEKNAENDKEMEKSEEESEMATDNGKENDKTFDQIEVQMQVKVKEKEKIQPNNWTRERKGIAKQWRKIAPEGISATKLKWTLWIVCILVNSSNVVRMSLFQANVSGVVTLGVYVAASVVGWVVIVIGFDAYKRSFLRKLKNSHRTEAIKGIKKVTYTTVAIIVLLIIYAIFSLIQSQFPVTPLNMTTYIMRGVVTGATIILYINCFGAKAAHGLWSTYKPYVYSCFRC